MCVCFPCFGRWPFERASNHLQCGDWESSVSSIQPTPDDPFKWVAPNQILIRWMGPMRKIYIHFIAHTLQANVHAASIYLTPTESIRWAREPTIWRCCYVHYIHNNVRPRSCLLLCCNHLSRAHCRTPLLQCLFFAFLLSCFNKTTTRIDNTYARDNGF